MVSYCQQILQDEASADDCHSASDGYPAVRISAANVTREDVEEDTLVLGVHDLPDKPPLVVGIHGLSNKPPKEALEHHWLTAIADGLSKYPIKTDSAIEFRLAYWADLRYPEPLPTWTPELSHESPGPVYEPRRLDGLRKRATALLVSAWDHIRRLVPHKLRLRLMNRYLRDQVPDLIAYWTDPETREAISTRLREQLEPGRKTLVIAHSMGSIVAYDVLQQSLDVDALITIGSPLGLPTVWHQSSHRLKYPPVAGSWRNFSDPEDLVAANPFIPLASVRNRLIRSTYGCHGGNHNPHKSFGYLRSPEVAEAIWDFLKSA